MTEKTVTKTPAMKLNKKPAAAKANTTPEAEVASLGKVAAPAAAEKAETSEATTIGSEDQIVQIAHEVENIKEDKAFKLIPSLLEDIDRNQFKIGGLLSKINAEGWYQDKGFETFKAFVEATYGMKYRKAMYLIEIYNSLVEAGIPWDKVKHLGWTKLVEIIKHLTLENVDEWLLAVEGLTTEQIKELVAQKTKGTSAKGETNAVKDVKDITSMTFKLHKDQKETVREALDKCKHETGTEHDNVALEHICLNFLGGESKLAAAPSLKELMQGKSAEEVLEAFGEIFPDVTLEATLPE